MDSESSSASAPASEVAVLRQTSAARALLHPDRRRLLEALAGRPDSASGLARRLGDRRQRLNYHLRALEAAGLVEVDREERRGNCTERILRVVAQRFVVDPGALGDLAVDPALIGDRYSATYVIALAARAIRELAELREKAESQRKRLATAGLEAEVSLARPADLPAFLKELSAAIGEVIARYHDERAPSRPFRVVAGVYPVPGPPNAEHEKGSAR